MNKIIRKISMLALLQMLRKVFLHLKETCMLKRIIIMTLGEIAKGEILAQITLRQIHKAKGITPLEVLKVQAGQSQLRHKDFNIRVV